MCARVCFARSQGTRVLQSPFFRLRATNNLQARSGPSGADELNTSSAEPRESAAGEIGRPGEKKEQRWGVSKRKFGEKQKRAGSILRKQLRRRKIQARRSSRSPIFLPLVHSTTCLGFHLVTGSILFLGPAVALPHHPADPDSSKGQPPGAPTSSFLSVPSHGFPPFGLPSERAAREPPALSAPPFGPRPASPARPAPPPRAWHSCQESRAEALPLSPLAAPGLRFSGASCRTEGLRLKLPKGGGGDWL